MKQAHKNLLIGAAVVVGVVVLLRSRASASTSPSTPPGTSDNKPSYLQQAVSLGVS